MGHSTRLKVDSLLYNLVKVWLYKEIDKNKHYLNFCSKVILYIPIYLYILCIIVYYGKTLRYNNILHII